MGKIKAFIESEQGKDILIVLIVILVGLGSFELGRLSKGTHGSEIKINYPDKTTEAEASQTSNAISVNSNIPGEQKISTPSGKNYFASKRGKKYYTIGCSAGNSIKQENRVYFATSDEAEKAGYELSTSCK